MILRNSFSTATWEELYESLGACRTIVRRSLASLPNHPQSLSPQAATRFPTFGTKTNLPDGDAELHPSRPRRRRFRLAPLATTPFPTPPPLVPSTIGRRGRGFPHFPEAGLASLAQYPLSSRRRAVAALLRASSSSVW